MTATHFDLILWRNKASPLWMLPNRFRAALACAKGRLDTRAH
jgi:hypothetical protein